MKLNSTLLAFFICLCLCSCDDRNVIFSEKKVIEKEWSYQDRLEFDFEIKDISGIYEMVAKVTHDIEFPNQNIYTKIYTTYPNGKAEDAVVSFELANEFGQWNGDCSSTECVAEILLKAKALFKVPGTYNLSLEQYTRNENLEGIQSIEFELIKLPTS